MNKHAVRMVLFFTLLVFAIIFFFTIGIKTRAMDTPESPNNDISRTIVIVRRELETAKQLLMEKDKVLFEIYENNPFSESGHMAELELRRRYPKEYNRYIEAKGYLDDLYYSRFLMIANKDYRKEWQQWNSKK